VLEYVFQLSPSDLELKVEIDETLDEREDCYAETTVKLDEDTGVHKFFVRLATKALVSDAVLKGTCAHEALHIALIYFGINENLDVFWEKVAKYIPKALEILQRTYGTADEFIVGVLEPLIAVCLVPSPEPLEDENKLRAWVVTIHQPLGVEKE